MNKARVADWDRLEPLEPVYALVGGVDLVVVRFKDGNRLRFSMVAACIAAP
jgi:hypothetical protein